MILKLEFFLISWLEEMPWNLVIYLRDYWHWPFHPDIHGICKVTSQRPIGLGYRKLQYPEWDKDNAKFHCFELKWYDFNKCTVIIWLYRNGHLALEGMGKQSWYSPTFWIMTWSVTLTVSMEQKFWGMKCSDCMMPMPSENLDYDSETDSWFLDALFSFS